MKACFLNKQLTQGTLSVEKTGGGDEADFIFRLVRLWILHDGEWLGHGLVQVTCLAGQNYGKTVGQFT